MSSSSTKIYYVNFDLIEKITLKDLKIGNVNYDFINDTKRLKINMGET